MLFQSLFLFPARRLACRRIVQVYFCFRSFLTLFTLTIAFNGSFGAVNRPENLPYRKLGTTPSVVSL